MTPIHYRKIAILGFTEHRRLAPFADPTWGIWGINDLYLDLPETPYERVRTPSGAQVILDGQTVGVTPLSLPSVSGGQHTILLTMEGFNDYTEDISITSNGVTIDTILVRSSFAGGSSIGISSVTLIGSLIVTFLLLGLKRHP